MSPDPETIDEKFRQEDYEGIVALIGKVKPEALENRKLVNQIGLALYYELEEKQALAWFDRLMELRPANPKGRANAIYNRGRCHYGLKDWEQAERDFRTSLNLRRTGYAAHWLARALGAQEKYREAIEVLHSTEPENEAKYHNLLGACYNQLGNDQLSLRHYEECYRLKPNDPEVLASLTNAWDLTGQWKNIMEHRLEIVAALEDEKFRLSWDGYLMISALADAYYEAGDNPRAIRYTQMELEHPEFHDDLAVSYYNIGIGYQNMEKYRKASEYFEKALALGHERSRKKLIECIDCLSEGDAEDIY